MLRWDHYNVYAVFTCQCYTVFCLNGASPIEYSLEQVIMVRTDQSWHNFLYNCLIFNLKSPVMPVESYMNLLAPCAIISYY